MRKKLPPGSAGDRMLHKMVGEACTTCYERHEKGKEVVRAYAALKAVRARRAQFSYGCGVEASPFGVCGSV